MGKPSAKVVLVDITSWKAQTDIALTEAQQALVVSLPVPEVLRRAKLAAAFAETARLRLISLLDHIGLHQWLGLRSSEDLFGEASDLL
ncbi:hypothetical protein [Trinickia fusca]|uniref:Uncharacterized protein n=1 Tax=Trinickia fusca TaxID=2419777 RepID=A0A494X9U0_9BURK|nr:hypothetical protein [Trinickia fusca]RKP47485.1 hypothetical protein D7S89_14700 [Trinickia fusca]